MASSSNFFRSLFNLIFLLGLAELTLAWSYNGTEGKIIRFLVSRLITNGYYYILNQVLTNGRYYFQNSALVKTNRQLISKLPKLSALHSMPSSLLIMEMLLLVPFSIMATQVQLYNFKVNHISSAYIYPIFIILKLF